MGDVLWTREVITRQRITFAEQDILLDDCFRRYRVVRCCMDQTGLGEKPVEDAKRRHGPRVEGVLFTMASKQLMATIAKDAFEDRRVRIPKGVREIRDDLHKLQKVTTLTGAPRFIADRASSPNATATATPTAPGRCSWRCTPPMRRRKSTPIKPSLADPSLPPLKKGGWGGFSLATALPEDCCKWPKNSPAR